MKTTIEKLENNVVKMDITIDADVATTEYNKACKRLAQRVNIPGFRKGKAPRAILEKNLGVEYIKHDALDTLLPDAFAKVISENDLNIIAQPEIESFDFNLGNDVKIVAKVELKPEVKFEQYKGLEVEVEQFVTAEDAMEREIDELLEKFTKFEAVEEDRETKADDVVVFDFDGFVDGEAITGGSAKNYMLDLANSNFIPGYAEQLVGHKKGEEFTIDVTFPEEYHDEKLNGKPAQFKIKINEIKQKVKPELSDELAQKVGPFNTVDELKADIQKYLEKTAQTENDKRKAAKIFDAILDRMSVDVQSTMIEREKDVLVADFKQKLQMSGASWDDVIKRDGIEKVDSELREEALNRIKNSLMMAEIAKLENIQVTGEDLEQKIAELATMYQTDKGTIFKEITKNSAMIQSLTQQALNQKVTQFLLDNNNVKFVAEAKK